MTTRRPKHGDIIKADGNVVNEGTYIDAVWDRTRQASSGIGHLSSQIILGNTYVTDHRFDIPNTESRSLQIKTGAKKMNLTTLLIVPEAELFVSEFIEAPTITDGTTEVSIINADRTSTSSTTMTIYSNPSGISAGTTIEEVDMFGESGVGQNRRGDRYQSSLDFILKENEDYVIRITNNGAGGSQVHISIRWYEI